MKEFIILLETYLQKLGERGYFVLFKCVSVKTL